VFEALEGICRPVWREGPGAERAQVLEVR